MLLPLSVDKTPDGDIVSRRAIFEDGYFENVEYTLQINPTSAGCFIEYYGEDDTFLEDEEVMYIVNNTEKLI